MLSNITFLGTCNKQRLVSKPSYFDVYSLLTKVNSLLKSMKKIEKLKKNCDKNLMNNR